MVESARSLAFGFIPGGRINSTRMMRHEQKGTPRFAGFTSPILGGAVQESHEP